MKAIALAALVAGAVSCSGSLVGAGSLPVALVEEVAGNPGVEFMDYVAPGKVIRLGPQDTIVLSYLTSCTRERIVGGTVTVGAEQSEVQSGVVARSKVKCDSGSMVLTGQQASQFAGMVFRGAVPASGSLPPPQITLYGRSPIVELKGAGTLVIERLDRSGERHVLKVASKQLQRGAFYDLAKAGKTLAAGGTYKAAAGAQSVVFKIDPDAAPGPAPIVGRLLRFEPTS